MSRPCQLAPLGSRSDPPHCAAPRYHAGRVSPPAPTLPPTADRRIDRLALALLLVAVALAFAPALGLGFWNADDWLHIEVAAGLLGGEPGAWQTAWFGYVPADALRLGAYVLWAADWLLFGLWAPGYYATNLLIHLGTVAAVFVLARRLAGSTAPALVAAALFGLNVATTQPIYFLASREDGLSTLLFVATAAAWPRLRGSLGGAILAGLLVLAACLTKLPAGVLPGVLLLLEGIERRQDRRAGRTPPPWLRLALPVAAGALVYGLMVVLTVDLAGAAAEVTQGRRPAPPELLLRRAQVLLAPASALRGEGWLAIDAIAPVGLLAAAVTAALTRRAHGGLALAGGVWLVVCLAIPLPWLRHVVMSADLGGRYLLLPSVGWGLLLASLLPRAGGDGVRRVRQTAALAVVVGGLLAAGLVTRPMLALHRSPTVPLIRAMAEELDDADGPRRLVVGLQRPDRGVVSLLASRVPEYRFAALDGPPEAFLQGGTSLLRNGRPPFVYGELEPGDPLDLAELLAQPSTVVLAEGPRPADSDEATAWTRPAPVARPPEGAPVRWDFVEGPAGWATRLPAGADVQHHEGWRLRAHRTLDGRNLGFALRQGGERVPHLLASPAVELDPNSACALQLRFTLESGGPHGAPDGFLASGFALLSWSDRDDFGDAFDRTMVLPLAPGDQLLVLDLRNSPAWRAASPVRRIGLTGPSVPGRLVVHRLDLLPCTPASSSSSHAGAPPRPARLDPPQPLPSSSLSSPRVTTSSSSSSAASSSSSPPSKEPGSSIQSR
jgi:hypothetical protein